MYIIYGVAAGSILDQQFDCIDVVMLHTIKESCLVVEVGDVGISTTINQLGTDAIVALLGCHHQVSLLLTLIGCWTSDTVNLLSKRIGLV